MLKQFFRLMVIGVSLLLMQQVALAADVTVHQVYEAAKSGHMSEALAMMDQVLRDHPNSGQAHFIEAELLARTGKLDQARQELAIAKQLSPTLQFAKPSAVQALQAQLYNSQPGRMNGQHSDGLPWGLMIMFGLLILSAILFVRSLRQRAAMQAQPSAFGNVPPAYGPNYGPGYGPGYGQGGGMGSGILGGLATGAALGAGMVAGEALADRLIDGHDAGHGHTADNNFNTDVNHDMGGSDFGLSDSSWDSGSGGSDFGGDMGGGDWN